MCAMTASATSYDPRPTLRVLAMFVVLSISSGSPAWAQTDREPSTAPMPALEPGMSVWITDARGHQERIRLAGISGDVLTAAGRGRIRQIHKRDITRIQVRRSDSLLNGALIGAGSGVASGLLICNLMEPWENCRDDVGPMFAFAGLGAAIGMGIDALRRDRAVVYDTTQVSTQFSAAPIVTRSGGGVRVSFRF